MKIYIATPVNGRREKTLEEKQQGAMRRIDEIIELLREFYPDADFINPVKKILTYHKGLKGRESTIMGTCIQMVMDSDMIVLDENWMESDGCKVERFVAFTYRKKIKTVDGILLAAELNGYLK